MTTVTRARGEGLVPVKTSFGLDLTSQRGIVLLVVEEHLSRIILDPIIRSGRFDNEPGSGISFQLPIEEAIGLDSQIRFLSEREEGRT